MKQMIILDIKKKHNIKLLKDKLSMISSSSDKILSLTPYSTYLLDQINLKYNTFHDLYSVEEFRELVISKYIKMNRIFNQYSDLSYLARRIIQLTTYETYIEVINKFVAKNKSQYSIIYITDTSNMNITINNIFSNKLSMLHFNKEINEIIIIESKSTVFYLFNQFLNKIKSVCNNRDFFKKFLNKIINKYKVSYDNLYFSELTKKTYIIDKSKQEYSDLVIFKNLCLENLINIDNEKLWKFLYENIFNNLENDFTNYKIEDTSNLFSYLSNNKSYIKTKILRLNKIPTIFTQHGSYLYNHFFYKNCEIIPANINFVSNEYTKEKFTKIKKNSIYNVGSILFNYEIKFKKLDYDYLYITYNTNYSGNTNYVESEDCLHSMDANFIFNKHKSIIDLFGTRFKNKTICIKIQPGIMTGSMLYIPFLELSEDYPNITIEFSVPIRKLIQKSKYIISDYFSSEFINRELHYKRDIILFKGAPLPLPKETLENMKKMFILVDTIDDLADKIINIESVTKNRKRYGDIIEYYSSKKCDTKKVVTEILEKELNGR
jgi:hypothetical protein